MRRSTSRIKCCVATEETRALFWLWLAAGALFASSILGTASGTCAMSVSPVITTCIASAESMNEEGNSLFRTSLFDAAAQKYQDGASLLLEHAERGKTEVNGSLCKLLANRAAALLRVGCEREALDVCTTALRFDPSHTKAKLRRCMANERLGRIPEALDDCDSLLVLIGRDSDIGKQCLEVRRRVAKLSATKEAQVPFYNPGHICSNEMTLRSYFSTPPPSAVPLGTFFTVSIYTANEFGLYDRENLQESAVGVKVGFRALGAGSGLTLETRREEELQLDRRGRATFQLRFVYEEGQIDLGSMTKSASVAVGVVGGSLRGGIGVMDVASLHVRILPPDDVIIGFERGVGGAWCARPLLLEGMKEPLLIAECPDHGIPGKIWDGGLVLAEFIAMNCDLVRGKRAIEFGSGTGLVGMASRACGALEVMLTDLEEHVPVLRGTMELNKHFGESGWLQAQAHEWGVNMEAFLGVPGGAQFDVVLGSDIIYEPKSWDGLVTSIDYFSSLEAVVLLAYRRRHEDDHQFFTALEEKFNIDVVPFESKMFPLARDINIFQCKRKTVAATAPAGATAVAE